MTAALSQCSRERLLEHTGAVSQELPDSIRRVSIPAIEEIVVTRRVVRYLDCFSDKFQRAQKEILSAQGEAVSDSYNRLLLSQALADFDPSRYIPASAPDWLLESYVERAHFIAERLVTAPTGEYAGLSEHLIKDLRILGGVSFPSYHHVCDWQAHLPRPYPFGTWGGWRQLTGQLVIMLRARGLGPYLRAHLDQRFLEVRRRLGANASLPRFAQLMQCCPELLGTVSTNWLEDPQMEWVSPQVYSKSVVERANGGFLLRGGTSPQTRERALRMSKRRRQLYEQGKYEPREYTLIWPRRNALAWYARAGSKLATSDSRKGDGGP